MNWRVRLSLSRTVFIDWKGKRGQNLKAMLNIFVDENFSVIAKASYKERDREYSIHPREGSNCHDLKKHCCNLQPRRSRAIRLPYSFRCTLAWGPVHLWCKDKARKLKRLSDREESAWKLPLATDLYQWQCFFFDVCCLYAIAVICHVSL